MKTNVGRDENVAQTDQKHAEAISKLRDAKLFVVATLNRDGHFDLFVSAPELRSPAGETSMMFLSRVAADFGDAAEQLCSPPAVM